MSTLFHSNLFVQSSYLCTYLHVKDLKYVTTASARCQTNNYQAAGNAPKCGRISEIISSTLVVQIYILLNELIANYKHFYKY